jgi:PilZ domain
MGITDDEPVRREQPVGLGDFLDRANRPWNPIQVAGRHFNALVRDDANVPALADFDDLYDVADLAVHWIEHHPCPDKHLERRLRAQMMGYRAVADTVRCTITDEDGDLMVARLSHLRKVIEIHADAIDESTQLEVEAFTDGVGKQTSIIPLRRRVPRQLAGWSGTCVMEGDDDDERRDCRVVDISMLGLGLILEHPSPSELVGGRVSVEVSAVDDRVNIRLEGIVRHAAVTSGGTVRVGVEFDDEAESESYSITTEITKTPR